MNKLLEQLAKLALGFSTALLMAAPGSSSAASPAAAGDAAANKAKVEAILKAWKDGHGQLGDLLADDVKWTIAGHSALAGTTTGKAQLMEKVLKPFGQRFSQGLAQPFRPTDIHAVYADGDVVVALFDGRGVTNEGEVYANSYAWVLSFRNGLVSSAVAFFDAIAFDRLMVR